MSKPIHLIGLPTDQNSSFERGAALAPSAIRAALWSDRGNLSAQSGEEIGTDIILKDIGDLPLSDVDCAADDAAIMQAVADTVSDGGYTYPAWWRPCRYISHSRCLGRSSWAA